VTSVQRLFRIDTATVWGMGGLNRVKVRNCSGLRVGAYVSIGVVEATSIACCSCITRFTQGVKRCPSGLMSLAVVFRDSITTSIMIGSGR